jgi:hypothetical protein
VHRTGKGRAGNLTHRPLLRRFIAALAAFAVASSLVQVVAAASPRAGVAISAPEISRMLATMDTTERAVRGASFRGTAVVAYQRMFLPTDRYGRQTGAPLALSATAPISESATGNGLYVSVGVSYEHISGNSVPYRWNIDGYWKWTYGFVTCCVNNSYDHVSTAWGKGLGLLSKYSYGYYTNGPSIAMYSGTVNIDGGFDYYFHEWYTDQNYANHGASWGHELSTIGETRLQNAASGVRFEYIHTTGGIGVSISFSFPPTISLSTTDQNWPLDDYTPVVF